VTHAALRHVYTNQTCIPRPQLLSRLQRLVAAAIPCLSRSCHQSPKRPQYPVSRSSSRLRRVCKRKPYLTAMRYIKTTGLGTLFFLIEAGGIPVSLLLHRSHPLKRLRWMKQIRPCRRPGPTIQPSKTLVRAHLDILAGPTCTCLYRSRGGRGGGAGSI